MAVENVQELVGTRGETSRWVVEEGKIREFTKALGFTDAIARDADAAEAAGFDGIVAPPTFGTAANFWMTGEQPLRKAKFDRKRVLHGEQEFEIHKPVTAGMVLEGTPEITDVKQKEGKRGGMMTFVTTDIVWRDVDSGDEVLTTRSTILERAPVQS